MLLSVIHMIALGVDAVGEFSGWLKLDQWTLEHWQAFSAQDTRVAASGAAFWSTVGSFAIPTFLLGFMIVYLDRLNVDLPQFIGWAMVVWMSLASLIIEPSGFPAGLIIAICLVWGLKTRRADKFAKSGGGS